jgi:hypothetical protein
MHPDSPDLERAKQLIDQLKLNGFWFQRLAPGEDAPLVGHRVSQRWLDLIHIEGFSRHCFAWRQQASPLIGPACGPQRRRVDGTALDVLSEVLSWQAEA